ncbi:heme biosynthesis HemY N-terminal domain-containing protein [Chitinibacteraceae bacterium HSL-7]
MKALIWLIALFSLAVGLTVVAHHNNGYAVLFLPPWRVELSLNAFILLVLVLAALAYLLIKVVSEVGGLPGRVGRYRAAKKETRAQKLEREAVLALYEGRFQRAERKAAEALALAEQPDAMATNGLRAARAAHAMRDFKRRDALFEQLRSKLGPQHLALLMTEAELYLDERRDDMAERAIVDARAIAPKLTALAKLELKLRQRKGETALVLPLIDELIKADAIEPIYARQLRLRTLRQQLQTKPLAAGEFRRWWNRVPDELRTAPELVLAAVDMLETQGELLSACEVLEVALETQWSSDLIERYGLLPAADSTASRQLQQAEHWLGSHHDDAALLLALGRLCRRASLWGKAEKYFEASLAIQPSAITHAEFARLLESLERSEEAARHLRAGLALALG